MIKPFELGARLVIVETKLREAMEMCVRPKMEVTERAICKALDCVAQVVAGPSRCRHCKNWAYPCCACRSRNFKGDAVARAAGAADTAVADAVDAAARAAADAYDAADAAADARWRLAYVTWTNQIKLAADKAHT